MKYPKNKYRKGYTYHSISDLLYHLEEGRWVYWDDRVLHPGFVISMTLRTVAGAIRSNRISETINQREEYYKGEYQKPYPPGVTRATDRK